MRALIITILTTVSSYSSAFSAPSYCTDCGSWSTPFGPADARYTYYCFITIEGRTVKAHKFYDHGIGLNDRAQCNRERTKLCPGARFKHWTNIRPNPCAL